MTGLLLSLEFMLLHTIPLMSMLLLHSCMPRSLTFKILFEFLSCPVAVQFILVILFSWI